MSLPVPKPDEPTPSGFFVFRTPLLPFEAFTTWNAGLQALEALKGGGPLEEALASDRALLRLGRIGPATRLLLDSPERARRHTRLDTGYLSALAEALCQVAPSRESWCSAPTPASLEPLASSDTSRRASARAGRAGRDAAGAVRRPRGAAARSAGRGGGDRSKRPEIMSLLALLVLVACGAPMESAQGPAELE